MRLPDAFLEELRARTPLAALIGRRVKLVRAGRQWKACCPFHNEKSPSFYIYDDGYHCFGCGAHGDAISFVMQSQGGTFMDAVQMLAGEAGLDVPKPTAAAAQAELRRLDLHEVLEAAATWYQANLNAPAGAEALAYLRRRGLSDATIARFGLGWAGEGRGALAQALAGQAITSARLLEAGLLRPGEDGAPRSELFFNRVMFPIRDRRGRVISFGGRTLGDGQPKYVNGPETAVFSKRRTLYGIDFARAAARQHSVIVVEGYMDVIALHQAGFGAAVAPLGTALTEDQINLLWQISPAPVLCFDGDEAGGRAAARAADLALPLITPERTIRIAALEGGDPDTLVRAQGAAAMGAVIDNARPLHEALFDLLRRAAGTATPEQRAAFRARLESAAGRIADRGLAQEYRRDLLDRYFAAFRRNAKPAAPRLAGRPVATVEATRMERMRTLIAILLRHPCLAHKLEDALGHLDLPPAGRRLAEAVLAYADEAADLALARPEPGSHGSDNPGSGNRDTANPAVGQLDSGARDSGTRAPGNLDFDGLLAHLTHFDLTDDIAWALGDVPCPSPAYASASATAVQAEAGWWHIYALLRGNLLEAEVAAAGARFHASQDAADLQRLGALLTAREQWRRGEAGEQSSDVME